MHVIAGGRCFRANANYHYPGANGNSVSDKLLYDPWEINAPFDCSDNTIFSLTLLDFKVSFSKSAANCSWQTASEINPSHFNIQRGLDAIRFENIGKINASGNSASLKSYQFTDYKPVPEVSYYRLQMVHRDGKYTYIKIVAVNIFIKGGFSMYPNPAKDQLSIQLKNDKAEKVTIQVIDMPGKFYTSERNK